MEYFDEDQNTFNPSSKRSLPSNKLVSLFSLLDKLGWFIASEEPNISDTFALKGRTQKRFGLENISRSELESELVKLNAPPFLYRTDHLIIWKEQISPTAPNEDLSKRQTEIRDLLLGGMTHSEIAKDLGISPRTVDKHIQNIYQKHGVKSYNELLFSLK